MKQHARLSLGAHDTALFASDMHLGDHDPDTAALFFASLDAQAQSITHLFLLGDIFEAWVGDDQPDSVAESLAHRLSALTARGVHVALMRGNRDFLLGVAARSLQHWPTQVGAVLLDEPSIIDLFGTPVMLAHGDAWCTDDLRYQQFRAEVRSVAWQQSFLARPLTERLAIARAMREQSERNKLEADIGDVNEAAVQSALTATEVQCVIHGHTHRPGHYPIGASKALQPEASSGRWVLPDWLAASGRGGWLRVEAQGIRLCAI